MRVLFCLLLLVTLRAQAGDSTKLYDPRANAAKDVAQLVEKAKAEKKHVLLQVGGNWCVWCYRFNAFVQLDPVLKKLVDQNYVVYHLNYSPENKNLDYLNTIGYPQRFGFPVFVVLDANGQRLHTQDSGLLEKEKSYDKAKVKTFLQAWSPKALDAKSYKE